MTLSPPAANHKLDDDDGNGMIVSISEEMNPSRRCTMEDVCVHYPPDFFRVKGKNPSVPSNRTSSSPKKKRLRSGCTGNASSCEIEIGDQWQMLGVYDGHGGRAIADYLDENLGRILAEELHSDDIDEEEPTPVLERIERAMLLADVDSYQRGIHASGATVVLCLIRQQPLQRKKGGSDAETSRRCTIYTANCGDARAVLCDGHAKVSRLSFDHKAEDRKEIQRVEDAGGFVLKGRVLGVLAVARSMGDHLLKEFVTARPHLRETVLEYDVVGSNKAVQRDDPNCKLIQPFLIVACDGLWDVVKDDEAVTIVQKCMTTHSKNDRKVDKIVSSSSEINGMKDLMSVAAKALTAEALKRGSTDNISVIVAMFQ
jgi:serine/threonine protein phosphatase PrpC